MKKFLPLLLALSQALALSGTVLAAEPVTTDVIVELSPPNGASPAEFAANCADSIDRKLSDFEYGYIYDTLLCGFSAELPETAIWRLENYDFVKKVYRCAEYEALSAEAGTGDMSAAEMIGLSAAEKAGLTGDGVKVAVLDSGFDINHPAFNVQVTETLELEAFSMVIGSNRLTALRNSYDIAPLYHSSKIPFMYDYAYNDADVSTESSNHGTHVAGIIGAAETEISDMHGIAPGVQLLLMKVFNDEGTSASDKALIAALEDAIKLGADVVNLSIGHYSGSVDPAEIVGLASLIEKAEQSGCIIIGAAGNDSVTTQRSRLYEEAEIMYPLASYTDYGTLSSPSAASYAMSVASANNGIYYSLHFKHAENHELYIEYTDTNAASEVIDVPFGEYFGGKTLEYAVIPGVGEEKDYDGIDVTGKLALVSRGTIMFTDKANIAAKHGAVGVIVYNNTEGEEYFNMELTDAAIPAIAISLEDGLALIDETARKLTFGNNYTWRENTDGAGLISSFSSYGTTPSLTLKPDISAIGSSVLSTVVGGGYSSSSGTSMASPQLAGACALLIEKARNSGITDNAALAVDVKNALMNTASPILQANGIEYSPRAQGAGLIDLEGAIDQSLELTYTATGKAKAELFDKLTDVTAFDITLKNLTDAPLKVDLGVTLTSDGYTLLEFDGKEEYYSTLTAEADRASKITVGSSGNLNRYADDHTPLTLTLDAGEARTLTVSIDFDDTYHKTLGEIFTNGHFAEGFVICETEGATVSLPYMGYIGDWGAAPVLDGDAYAGETEMFDGTKFYVMVNGKYIPAGADIFAETYVYDRDTIAFSPNGDDYADDINFGATAIRNCKSSSMTITDPEGNTVYTSKFPYFSKTVGMEEVTVFRFHWDGSDGMYSRYKLPDGKYTVSLEYTLDYGEDVKQTYTYPVIIDTVDPTLSSVTLDGDTLSLTASDEFGVRVISIYENDSDGAFFLLEHGSEVSFNIGKYTGDTLYYEIIDNAYNITVGKLTLSDLAN
ncbi:MAG: S8 family serine peptidase [Clostridia bacterium]|nr:S8 family serine peptidase [Clostridia bacterium]